MAIEDARKLGLTAGDPVAGPLAGGQCFDSRPGLDSAGRLDASGAPDYNAIVEVLPAPA